jgi:hypothetical protein
MISNQKAVNGILILDNFGEKLLKCNTILILLLRQLHLFTIVIAVFYNAKLFSWLGKIMLRKSEKNVPKSQKQVGLKLTFFKEIN